MSIAAKLRKLKNANYQETKALTLPDGMQVILSTLTGEEDRMVGDYLRQHLGKSLGHYTKLESLAHAIKWLRDPEGEETDLRGLKYIETGEHLSGGKPIKMHRYKFMREIVNSWPDIIVDTLYGEYALLMQEIDKNISKKIKVELGDSTLLLKVVELSDELRELVQKAQSKGLDVDSELLELYGSGTLDDEDALIRAFKASKQEAPEPAKEETVEPEMDEVPQSIRK